MSQPTPEAPVLPAGLDTPSLVIDLDIVERNAQQMAQAVAARGVALRPHIKTHKSVALARLQLEAGAIGISVGTLGEAEVMAASGIGDILIAYPLWAGGAKAARLRALLDLPGLALMVGADSVAGAHRLGAAVEGVGRRLHVLLEVDCHYGRTGVAPAAAGELGLAAREAGLEVVGAFTHGGHAYAGHDAVDGAAADEVSALAEAAAAMRDAGIEPQVLSAGSSPTALGAATEPVTDVRPGTYLINDRMQVALGAAPADGVAIAVAATVVSDNVAGQIVIDAGAKSLTKDVAPYLVGHGVLPAYPDGVIERLSDYHGQVRFPDGAARPSLGEVVAVVPNHVCPAVDLFDSFIASRSGEIVGRWPVDARGRSA